ncbi:unnamed protein product [Rodentolepis nana]|uniref:Reverse transcriptase domain-containing protein n=1 Tax=Rodentolepis nana TaxID=102285 RepID=A0A3P7V7J8_RODNA|nr:unnamed protein product [Rodentolepis nana]
MTWFLETNNILRSEQAGFRPQRSTNQQVATLSQHIKDALDARNTLTAVFVDFKSPYDLVWKEKPILKLTKIGIKHNMLNWIKAFIGQRSCKVRYGNALSKSNLLQTGLPQRAVTSCTLFNVFINDIAELVQTVTGIKCLLYADDHVLWYSAPKKNPQERTEFTGSTTICSLIKEKAFILYEKLLRIPIYKFFSTYENRPRHLKTHSGLIQEAIELKKELQMEFKQKSLSPPMDPFADTDVVFYTQLLDFFRKSNTPQGQMRSLALEKINVNHLADQWLQVFTDGSYIENQANIGAGVYSELFSFYAAVGHNRSAFEGDIEAIRIALCQ